jgi:hypothetical protein
LGSVAGALGRLAELAGDEAAAIAWYEDAVERERLAVEHGHPDGAELRSRPSSSR